MPSNSNTAKNDMLSFCRSKYENNQQYITAINKFEITYSSEDAIQWYANDTFLYRLLNETFRIDRNSYGIFCFRFYAKDLHDAITHQHKKSTIASTKNCLTVYRGQRMLKSELWSLIMNKHRLISINGFWSTTCDPEVAMMFAGYGAFCLSYVAVVLFEIDINQNNCAIPFTSTKNNSIFGDSEQEILFSVQATFQIESIKQIKESDFNEYWSVKLTPTCRKDNEKLKILSDCLEEEEFSGTTSLLRVGEILVQIQERTSAERFYRTILKEFPLGHRDIADAHNNLGEICCRNGKYEASLYNFGKALETASSDLLKQKIQMNINNVYMRKGLDW
ncbi:unnamed protein product [Didymodactylos carnosus]|uniref:Uncharacterized protein n=1 Tax=Didymodactylos carnosus TaxID=1234261 RepID=A0A816C5I2_9BILA|nr:unnamed protein product [Didymodactylos carnosus]CAF4506027.1 unnamed protein product [Didymodactylos carnosus]